MKGRLFSMRGVLLDIVSNKKCVCSNGTRAISAHTFFVNKTFR